MKHLAWLFVVGASLCGVACEDEATTTQGGTTGAGNGGSGAAGAAGGGGSGGGGSTADGGGGAGGGQGGSGGAGGGTCGGVDCSTSQFCDFQPSDCGASRGSTAMCAPRPGMCPDIYAPVCGCDGVVHGNSCDANAAGTDYDETNPCAPPRGFFPCGWMFCAEGSQYCQIVLSDVAGFDNEYSCPALPGPCGNNPDCSCVAGEACGNMCTDDGSGNLTVTCPGG
jgi:hypothetical protein